MRDAPRSRAPLSAKSGGTSRAFPGGVGMARTAGVVASVEALPEASRRDLVSAIADTRAAELNVADRRRGLAKAVHGALAIRRDGSHKFYDTYTEAHIDA
jgi:hypothetical protein